jgi:uncharacterized membrane protein YdjX (TVP38/TMEM64 family)/Fe-S oxidoreductase
VPATSDQGPSHEACNGCGICADLCPVLASRGTPDQIAAACPADAFLCTNCGACREACPLGIDPGEVLRQIKETAVARGDIPPAAAKALAGARSFAVTGHRFPFRHYPAAATIFWPGCGLAGRSPAAVKKIAVLLEKRLGEPVGIALDCCFDPVGQIGDAKTLQNALGDINKQLRAAGTERIVTGCLNCRKVFAKYLPEMKIDFLLDLIADDIDSEQLPPTFFLHHPCPSTALPYTRLHIEDRLAQSLTARMEDSLAACCGSGGGLPALAPDLAGRFAQRIIGRAGSLPIVTYCTGCHRQFQSHGRKALHLFSCLPGIEPIERVATVRSWLNRFLLSAGLHLQGVTARRLLAGFLITVLAVAGIIMNRQGLFSAETILAFLQQHSVAAPLLFVLIYAVAPSLLLPSIPLTLAAGFLWGPVWGVVFSIVGATIGSCLPFFLARTFLGGLVRKRFRPEQWEWLTEKVEKHGWKAVAFTRLIPVFPFNLLNYLFGLTPIPFRHYLWSTFLFMLPACVAFVAFGSSLGALLLTGDWRGVLLGIAVAAAAIILTVAFKPYFRKIMTGSRMEPPPAGRKEGR